jgi:oxygen-independent coproporphyrinogen III oxidase
VRLYVHWPFCISRCSYCDFNSRVCDGRRMREYMCALLSEISAWAELMGEEKRGLRSVYLGGGTPSTLSGVEISELLGGIGSRFGLSDDAETTVEVNPATWKAGDYAAARTGGVNRISVGVQSLHDPSLVRLGRLHDAAKAMMAIKDALGSGVLSVSVDLMFGLPGMDKETLLQGLRKVIGAGVHHISLYALTLSGRSRMSRAIQRGELALPDEDEAAEQYLAACEELREAGYEHYEISNFCLPGHRSRHNLAYWEREEYLGVGAGAYSFVGGCRFNNVLSLLDYMRRITRGISAIEGCEYIGKAEERKERIMLGLRTVLGVPDSMLDVHGDRLYELEDLGLLHRDTGRIRLTGRGMLVSNTVILELLPA